MSSSQSVNSAESSCNVPKARKYLSDKTQKTKYLEVVHTEFAGGRSRIFFAEFEDPSVKPGKAAPSINPDKAAPNKCYITGTRKRGLGITSDRRGGLRDHTLIEVPAEVVEARKLQEKKVKKIKKAILKKPEPVPIEPHCFKQPAPVNTVIHQDLLDKAAAEKKAAAPQPTISKSDPRLVEPAKQQQVAQLKQREKEQAAQAAREAVPEFAVPKPLYTKAQRERRQTILAELEDIHQQKLKQLKREQLDLFYSSKLHIICFDNPAAGVKLIKAQQKKSYYRNLVAAYRIWNKFSHNDKAVIRYMTPRWAENCFGIKC